MNRSDGFAGRSGWEQPTADYIASRLEYVKAWLRHFAHFYLDNSNGYNAAKHGLSTLPGHSRVSFVAPPDDEYVMAEQPDDRERAATIDEAALEVVMMAGPGLESLEHDGKRMEGQWMRVRRAVDQPGLLVAALVCADLLDQLWIIAQARHLGLDEPVPVSLVASPMPQDIIQRSPFVRSTSTKLAMLREPCRTVDGLDWGNWRATATPTGGVTAAERLTVG